MKIKKNLTEGSSWNDQIDKMLALENGTRGFNARAASDQKLQMNRQICQSYNLPTALDIVETEMVNRGLISQTTRQSKQAKQQQPQITPALEKNIITFTANDFHSADAKFINDAEDEIKIIANCIGSAEGETKVLLRSLVLALCLNKSSEIIQAIKGYITTFEDYDNASIKKTILDCTANPEIIARLNQITAEIKNN